MRKKWLIAGSHPLDSVFKVSTYHLARGLACRADNEVFYLCAPISPLHRLRPRATTDLSTRRGLWREGPKRREERLLEYCPMTWLPYANKPLVRGLWAARRTLSWTRPRLARILDRARFSRPDVLLVVNLQYAGLLDLVEAPIKLYRNIDEIGGMAHVPRSMLTLEREVARRVDAVLVTSVVQEEKMHSYEAERVFRLPHGVDLAMFQGPPPPMPRDYGYIARPRVVFVGALTQWVDHELLAEVAKRLPRVSFVFIGPADPPFPDVLTQPNMRYLGPRPYEDLPAYLRHADAAMIPFVQRSAIVQSAHPLKLLMYLAAGLPTICTPWRELEAMGFPVRTGKNAQEFAREIDRALKAPPDPKLAESVRDYDWSRIVARLEKIVADVAADKRKRTTWAEHALF